MGSGVAIDAIKDWGGLSAFFLVCIAFIKVLPSWKKADSDAVTALHKDYGDHIDRLQRENMGLRDRLSNLETDYEQHRKECRAETDKLHADMRVVMDQVVGLQRDLAQHSQSSAVLLNRSGNA